MYIYIYVYIMLQYIYIYNPRKAGVATAGQHSPALCARAYSHPKSLRHLAILTIYMQCKYNSNNFPCPHCHGTAVFYFIEGAQHASCSGDGDL